MIVMRFQENVQVATAVRQSLIAFSVKERERSPEDSTGLT